MNSEKKPFITQILWVIIIITGVAIVGQMAYSSYKLWQKRDIVTEREQYLQGLETQQIELKNQLSQSMKVDFIEKEARNKLGLAKPGETLVIMPEGTASGQVVNGQSLDDGTSPNWQKWWKLLLF